MLLRHAYLWCVFSRFIHLPVLDAPSPVDCVHPHVRVSSATIMHRGEVHSGEATATVSCIACIHLHSIVHHLLYLSWIHSRSLALMSVMLLVACELMKLLYVCT